MTGPTERTDPPLAGTEAETLVAFLNYFRDTIRRKTEGLTQEQLAIALEPSPMTLGGLLKHLALVDFSWFSEDVVGEGLLPPFGSVDWDADPDWEWRTAADDSPQQLRTLYDDHVAASDRILKTALAEGGLDQLSASTSRRTGEHYSLRWILLHLIEEYARHCGHADLIRESIDGSTGA
jgi:uncharacterized damage-inducible protein DinB